MSKRSSSVRHCKERPDGSRVFHTGVRDGAERERERERQRERETETERARETERNVRVE